MYKIGQGIDAHIFSDSGTLQLGLVKIAGYKKLAADSDGDVVAHAIVDALLSSAGQGDIGSVFGVGNPETVGVSGEEFLRKTMEIISPLQPSNVVVNIVTSAVKIAPVKGEMMQKLEAVLQCPVAISATTTDGFWQAETDGVLVIANCLCVSDDEIS